jgi:hypothetical protein
MSKRDIEHSIRCVGSSPILSHLNRMGNAKTRFLRSLLLKTNRFAGANPNKCVSIGLNPPRLPEFTVREPVFRWIIPAAQPPSNLTVTKQPDSHQTT